jgi:hypothetical protein
MSPAFFESLAPRLWPYRWWAGLGAFAVGGATYGFLWAIVELKLSTTIPLDWVVPAFLLPFSWLWGVTLIGVWFHPAKGTARVGSPWFLRSPRSLQVGWRWYAAIFLTFWFCLPVVVWVLLLTRSAA